MNNFKEKNTFKYVIYFSLSFRWLQECPNQARCCPTCKAKAAPKDLRGIYAKKVAALDKSEEYRLQDLVEKEKEKTIELQSTVSALKLEISVLKENYVQLESKFERAKMHGGFHEPAMPSPIHENMYRISMERTLELNGSCRAMVYGRLKQTLYCSQKSNMALFPGYGVRYISAHNLMHTNIFFRMAAKSIRDLTVDAEEEIIACASADKAAHMYNVGNHAMIGAFAPNDSNVWSITFDQKRTKIVYVGTQKGSTYVYDIRKSDGYIEHCPTPGDFSPVISITPVPATSEFLFGGFLVCKLQSLWFYEYTSSDRLEQTKLNVEGPFVSIHYDEDTKCLLVATRPNSKWPMSRYIVGKLVRIDQAVVFRDNQTINGSNVQAVMSRSTQVNFGEDSMVAAYLQDTKTITTWNSKSGNKYQGFSMKDVIYDMCPIYVNNRTYLGALSEEKVRIFQVNSV